MSRLDTTAMMVVLNQGMPQFRKYDKKISIEVNNQYQVPYDTVRANKPLLAKDGLKLLSAIRNEQQKGRIRHYEMTLPWTRGADILPVLMYPKYTQVMTEIQRNCKKLVEQFVPIYPDMIEEAKQTYNGLFNPSDYPHPSTIERKFYFQISFFPMPTTKDFRVDLGENELLRIKEETEERINDCLQEGVRELWKRVYKVVEHVSLKLNDPDAQFKNSLIGNAIELVEILPKFNLTEDQELERMRRDIEAKLCAYSPDTLRENPIAREEVGEEAEKILDEISRKMDGYM